MAERGIRQVVVVENGKLRGVVNERDLFALQRVSMRQVNQDVARRRIGRAAEAGGRRHPPADAEPAGAGRGRRAADANHRLAQRRAVAAGDRARAGTTSISTTSTGAGLRSAAKGAASRPSRPTRTTRSCSRSPDAGDARRCAERLLAFARDVNADLDALGFPLCSGNVMAGNPELCLSVEEWKARFLAWIREPTPQALLNANIIFDFRPLYGDATLADALREWLFGYTQANAAFLRLMVQNALEVEPPLGLIRAFAVDDEPGGRSTIDLKTRGTRLFVDCARVFALAQGIAEAGTAARLRLAGEQLHVAARHVGGDRRGVSFPAAAASAAAGSAGDGRQSQPHRPVCAERGRAAHAEGGVPAGETAAGAAAALVPVVASSASTQFARGLLAKMERRARRGENVDDATDREEPAPGRAVPARRAAVQLSVAGALQPRDRGASASRSSICTSSAPGRSSSRFSRWSIERRA